MEAYWEGGILHYLHRKLYQELLNCVRLCSSFVQHVNCNINPLGYDMPLTILLSR